MVTALLFYAYFLYRHEQMGEAKKILEEAQNLSKQMDPNATPVSFVFAQSALAKIEWLNGDYIQAKALLLDSQANLSLLGDKVESSKCAVNLGLLSIEQGDLNQAQKHLEEAINAVRDLADRFFFARYVALQGILFYLQGNTDKFKQNFRESIFLAKEFDRVFKAFFLESLFVSTDFQLPENAAVLLGVIEHSQKELDIPMDPLHKRYCGQAEARVRKSLDDAVFDSRFAVGQEMSLDEALDLVLETVEDITEIKSPSNLGREEIATPTTLPSQREAEKQKYGGLTTREREVAAQIAQGKSNQTIAAELFVGLKTVEAHVTRILTKLGFTSRAQVAAWVVEKRLAEAPQDSDTLSREG